MAAPTAANVTVGSTDFTGGVFSAPSGTALPTNAVGAHVAAFDTGNLGLISEEGVSFKMNNETKDIKAWHNNVVVKSFTISTKVEFSFTMIELSAAALAEYFDTSTGTSAFTISGGTKTRKAYIVLAIDGTKIIRLVIPDGQVVTRGDFTLSGTDIIRLPVTLTAYPDDTGEAVYGYLGTGS